MVKLSRFHEFFNDAVIFIQSDLYPKGEFIKHDEARLSLSDLGFRHGFSIYDAGRAFRGKPWQLNEHIERLLRSCKACNLDLGITSTELEQICIEVCARNEPFLRVDEGEDFSIYIEATPGEYGDYGRSSPPPPRQGEAYFNCQKYFYRHESIGSCF